MRVAQITFSLKDNDHKLIEYGKNKTMEVMWAAGAEEVIQEPRYAHLIGGARMGNDPNTSVVDKFGRTHDVPNLFCCDGSILPTQGAANPGLTIQSLAVRTAEYIIANRDDVLAGRRGSMAEPAIHRELSPPGTHTRGIPQFVK